MRTVLCALLCLFLAQAVFAAEDSEHVLVLTDDTFDDQLAANRYVLVEFYAPWCGHCKSLAPHWNEAADKLAAWAADHEDIAAAGVKLAKVDCTVEKGLGARFGIQGYPTLKLFIGGADGAVSEYNKGRDADSIFNFMVKKAQGSVQILGDEAAFTEFTTNSEATGIVLVVDEESDESVSVFNTIADGKDDVRFARVTGAFAGVDAPALLAFRSFADQATFDGEFPLTSEALVQFVDNNAYDIVEEINQQSWPRLSAAGLPILIGVADFGADGDDGKAAEVFMQLLRTTAETYQGQLVISFGSKEGLGRAVEQFGGTGNMFPTMIGLLPPTIDAALKEKLNLPERWSFDENQALTPESLNAWLDSILAGEMKPFVKSEPVPEDNNGPVKVLVAKNFEEELNAARFALVEFYAPWCGHCKSLAPMWEELGQNYVDDEDVLIAKIDATANYVDPSFGVQGFPTLIFFENGKLVKNYEGQRTVDKFIDFIESYDKDDDDDADAKAPKDEL